MLTGNSSKDIVSKAEHLSCLTDDREFMFVMKLEDIYGYGQREVDTFIASSGLEDQGGMLGQSTSTSSLE